MFAKSVVAVISLLLIVHLVNPVAPEPENSNEKLDFLPGHLKAIGDHRAPEVSSVTVLDFFPSGRDFYAHFLRKRRPLLMKGVAKNWKAVKHWRNENYLREKYGSVLMDVEMGKVFDGSHLNVRQTINMSEFLDRYKRDNMYLDSPFPQSEMISDLELPFCMQCEELSNSIRSAHLLFSNGNTSSSLHHDGYENLFVVISGKKEFRIWDNTYGHELYGLNSSFPGLSPINPDMVDLVKFPKFADAPYQLVTLEPGDLFYNPINWWHHVRSYDSPNIAVSIWCHVFNYTMNELSKLSDVIGAEEVLAETIEKAPKTIECKEQNMPFNLALQQTSVNETLSSNRTSVPTVILANGYKMPMLGIGTGGYNKEFEQITEEIVFDALTAGHRLIDTSPIYNESAVGEAIVSSDVEREELFIISKVMPNDFGFSKTVQSVADALDNLQVDYIDLVLLNTKECATRNTSSFACDGEESSRESWKDAWKALEYLVDIGKIRGIGVSNFEVADLNEVKEFTRTPISLVQNWFDVFHTDAAVREWTKNNNVTYMGFSPLGGLWQNMYGFNPVLKEPKLQEIAEALDVDVGRVALHWAVRKGVAVIFRSTDVRHIKTNLLINDFRLTEDEMHDVDSLEGTLNPNDFTPIQPKVEEGDISNNTKTTSSEKKESTSFVYKNVVVSKVQPSEGAIFVSSDDHWIYSFDAETGHLKWKTLTGDETGSNCAFSLDCQTIYCGADDTFIRALSVIDGSLVWKFKANGPVTSSAHVTKNGNIIIGSHDHYLYTLTPAGELSWKSNLFGKVWSTPITSNIHGLVFIGAFVSGIENVLAYKFESGRLFWMFQAEGSVVGSPQLSPDESTVCIGDNIGNFYCLYSSNGTQKWSRTLSTQILSTPLITTQGEVFVGCYDGQLFSLTQKDGKTKWNITLSERMTSSPILGPDNVIYIGGGDGRVHAIRKSDGHVLWTTKIGKEIFFSSPRFTIFGTVIIGSVDGPLYSLNATSGQVVWKAMTDGPVVGSALITKEYAKFYI